MLGAGTSIEHPSLNISTFDNGIQMNVECNNKCSLTAACGDRCFLNVVQPDKPEMSEAMRWRALQEVLDQGPQVRHLALVGKEPAESPELLRRVLREYHQRQPHQRPQAIGMISNGLLLHKPMFEFLAEAQLDWMLISIDGLPETHRRGVRLWNPAFTGLLHVKHIGGARVCGVNSVLDGQNTEAVIALGRILIDQGIQYQGVGPYMEADDGRMVSQLSAERSRDVYHRLANAVPDGSGLTVMFEMSPEAFKLIAGIDPDTVVGGPWRLEHRVPGTSVVAATMSPEPGRFFRLRFDGAVLDKTDLMTIGVLETRYGHYEPGRMSQLIQASDEAWRAGRRWQPQPLTCNRR